VGFPFDQDRLEPTLEQRSNPVTPTVKTLSVNAVELAHADGEIGLRRLHQQMIMIGHQAVRVADPMVATHHTGQRFQKQLAVGVGKKHFLLRVAAARQMIDRSGKF